GLVECGAAQLVSGRSVAEPCAQGGAVARTDDVAQVRLVIERVAVLLRVALLGAQRLPRIEHDGGRLLFAALRDVDRAGAVAGLALDVAQLLVVREVRAAGLLPPGDVAADALVIELLAAIDERLPGVRV